MNKLLTVMIVCTALSVCAAPPFVTPEINPPADCILLQTYNEGPGVKDWSVTGDSPDTNTATWGATIGRSGGGYSYNGSNQHMQTGFGATFVGTFSVWIYQTGATSAASYLMDARSTGGTGWVYWAVGGTNINVSDGTVYVDGVATTACSANAWHFVTVTDITIRALSFFSIGRRFETFQGSWQYFEGVMDNYALYKRTLSLAEIKAFYEQGKAGQ